MLIIPSINPFLVDFIVSMMKTNAPLAAEVQQQKEQTMYRDFFNIEKYYTDEFNIKYTFPESDVTPSLVHLTDNAKEKVK